ncbi:MAG: RNA polymerase factor sigma-54 [Acidiferrobacterales bacterium]|nr:RNA polymerase factor sigma-54 [Acidiferrobacterales bacterium]
MKQGLSLKQSQRLTMTPQLQQAIKLLQMNNIELSEELLHAHETNPLLELEDPPERQEVTHEQDIVDINSSGEAGEALNEDWVSSQVYDRATTSAQQFEGDYDIPDNNVGLTLTQHLDDQLKLLSLSDREKLAADYLVGYIDEAGYLQIELEELLVELGQYQEISPVFTLEDIEIALKVVQSLEPIGVGARNPGECLHLQLNAVDAETETLKLAKEIVDHHLPLLGARDYQTMKKRLRCEEDALREAIKMIKLLNPHPGYSIGDVSVNYIAPDVVVEHHKGVWLARLNTGALPRVEINAEYQQLVNENASNASFSQMKEQLQDAKWLLANIEKRHSTILSVAAEIVERQQAFFDHGPAAMRPMILRDVAEVLDIHESTVSRATNGKYMLTPIGVFELKYFFSTELNASDGTNTSSVAIQTLIKEMINDEPPTKPISDMKICKALEEQGFEVARRTVAKYREQMNIPSTSKRKSL